MMDVHGLLKALCLLYIFKGAILLDLQGPMFLSEPQHRVEFSNNTGGHIECSGHGSPPPDTISTPPMPKVEFQLLMGKLLKSWTDMGYAKAPTEQFQPTRVILPPSGVLPPSPVSLGTNRVWTIMGKSQIAKAPAAPRNPNPSTVQNVIRVNKVSVVPQSFRPLGFGYVRNIGNVIPQSVPRITVVNLPSLNPSSGQISRRNGILVQRILPQTPVDVGREVGYDIEFIPSNGYYLNNEEERKSYFHTLRKRLLGLEKSSNFNAGVSSYNVPKSSRGSFFDARY